MLDLKRKNLTEIKDYNSKIFHEKNIDKNDVKR